MYEIENFLEKNRDRLREDLHQLLGESSFGYLKKLALQEEKNEKSEAKGSKKAATVGSRFHVI